MNSRAFVTLLLAAVLGLAACGQGQFYGRPAPPPARPSAALGPGAAPSWKAAAAYLKAHPRKTPQGMMAGILVQTHSHGYVCLGGYCHTWSGTLVINGGRVVHVSSDQGDNGMASMAALGDLIQFPAGNEPVDTPGDGGNDAPASVIVAQAVYIP